MAVTTPASSSPSPPPPPKKDYQTSGKHEGYTDNKYPTLEDGDGSDSEDDRLLEQGLRKGGNAAAEQMVLEDPIEQNSGTRLPMWMRPGGGEGRRRCLRPIVVVPLLVLLLLLAAAGSTAVAPDKARDLASKVLPSVFSTGGSPRARYAFATYVSGYNWTEAGAKYEGASDQFFDGARVINYQLRHAPSTRSRPDVDFIALVSHNVSQEGRDQLKREGARVVVSEHLTPRWVREWYGDGRWSTVMDKFTLAGMSEYEKICFLDADMVITERLDGIFDDPATAIIPSLGNPEHVNVDDAPEPPVYMFAAVEDRKGDDNFTSEDFDYLNAGFFCWHPSQEVFDFYMRFLNRENSFFPIYPEQNMLNLVHGLGGNLPFTRLNWIWNAHRPEWLDLMRGVHSYHAKGWLPSIDIQSVYPELHRVWWYQKREMEAYYADSGIQQRLSEDGTGFDKPRPKLVPEPPPHFIVTPPVWPLPQPEDTTSGDLGDASNDGADVGNADNADGAFGDAVDADTNNIDGDGTFDFVADGDVFGAADAGDNTGDAVDGGFFDGPADNDGGLGIDEALAMDEAGPVYAKRALAAGVKRSFLMPGPDGKVRRVVVGG